MKFDIELDIEPETNIVTFKTRPLDMTGKKRVLGLKLDINKYLIAEDMFSDIGKCLGAVLDRSLEVQGKSIPLFNEVDYPGHIVSCSMFEEL